MMILTECGYCNKTVMHDDEIQHNTDEHFYKGNCRQRKGMPRFKDVNGCT